MEVVPLQCGSSRRRASLDSGKKLLNALGHILRDLSGASLKVKNMFSGSLLLMQLVLESPETHLIQLLLKQDMSSLRLIHLQCRTWLYVLETASTIPFLSRVLPNLRLHGRSITRWCTVMSTMMSWFKEDKQLLTLLFQRDTMLAFIHLRYLMSLALQLPEPMLLSLTDLHLQRLLLSFQV